MLNDGSTYLPNAGEGDVPLWSGTYAATVVNNDDPLGVGRLQLNVPQVLGNSVSAWAVPLGTYYNIPNNGTTVSACFIGGDPAQPAWIGPLDLAPVVIAGTTRVFYSASAPASPAVGDVWYQSIGGVQAPPQVWTFDPVHSTFSWVTQVSLGTSAIGTGQVTGTNIAASTITARNINVGDSLNPNPYFGGGDISNWVAFATTGPAPVFTSVATTGGFGYPYAANVAAVAGASFPGISSTNFAVNAGDPVQVNGWFNTNAALQFTISYFNSGGSFVGQSVSSVGASAGNWQYQAINGNAVAGAVKANLTVKINTGASTGTEVFQATGLTVVTKLNGGIITAGTITALQIAAQTITADQLAVTGDNTGQSNPTFAGGSTAAWAAFNGSISAVQPGGSAFYPWAAKFTPSGSNNTGGINGFGPGITGTIVQCAPNNGLNFYAKVYATQTNMSLQMQWYTSAFGFISQTFLSTPVTALTWTDVSWIATPPATAAFGVPIIQMQAASGNLSATTDYFYASGINVLTSVNGGIISAGTINTAQLNAAAITGMTITGGTINGAKFVGTGSGEELMLYSGTPGVGNLSLSVNSSYPSWTTDTHTNVVPSGFGAYGVVGIPGGGGTEYWLAHLSTFYPGGLASNRMRLGFQMNTTGQNAFAVNSDTGYIEVTDGGQMNITANSGVNITGAAGAPVLVTTDTWHNMTLLNSWTNNASFTVARYRLMPNNCVKVQGVIVATAATSGTFFTLPAGYRPATTGGAPLGATGAGTAAGVIPNLRWDTSGNLSVNNVTLPVSSSFFFSQDIPLD